MIEAVRTSETSVHSMRLHGDTSQKTKIRGFKKLIVTQQVKNYPTCYGTLQLITMFTVSAVGSLSAPDESSHHPLFILIISSINASVS
jgi:hypothetical protein